MKTAVAVASNEKVFVDIFSAFLIERGKEVLQFSSIAHSMYSFVDNRCGMIVLGVKGLDECVIKLLENFRKVCNAPIFVSYKQASEEQRIAALNKGAAACVSRETSMHECLAMIDALIRIYTSLPVMNRRDMLSFKNGLVIDVYNWSVWMNGMSIKLTRREYFVLRYLAQNKNRVITRNELYCAAYQTKVGYEIDECVKSWIKSLRKKLGDYECQIIQNVRGVGYRLVDDE